MPDGIPQQHSIILVHIFHTVCNPRPGAGVILFLIGPSAGIIGQILLCIWFLRQDFIKVRVQEADPTKYNSLRIPASDQWGLIIRKDSPLAQHSCIHLHDLMNIPLILSRQAMGEEMPRWFGETQDELHIAATYGSAV